MDTDTALSQQLTAAVAATPGVTTVYASGTPIRAVVQAVADAVGSEREDAAKVAVDRHHDGSVSIGVTISVSDGAPVPTTTRLVGDAIRGILLARPDEDPVREIDVRVCRIEEGAASAR